MVNVTGQYKATTEAYVVTSVTIGFISGVLMYQIVTTQGYPIVQKDGFALVVQGLQTDNKLVKCHKNNTCILMAGKHRKLI